MLPPVPECNLLKYKIKINMDMLKIILPIYKENFNLQIRFQKFEFATN